MTITPESYIEKLGRENGRIVFAVLLKWIHAYSRFHDLRTVCTHSETQHLPTTMKQFYQRLRHLLWQDVILAVVRLTDPHQQGQGKYDNLTICRLPMICEGMPIQDRVRQLVRNAQKRTEPARKWRNRIYAHNELQRELNPKAWPLPPVDLDKMEEMLKAIHSPLGKLYHHCHDGHALSSMVTPSHPDIMALFIGDVVSLVAGAKLIEQHIELSGKESFGVESSRNFLRSIGADVSHENLTALMDFRVVVSRSRR